jgi:hypothetical protein
MNSMKKYTSHLLTLSLVVTSAALANPCYAQTVDSKENINNDTSITSEPISESNNSSQNKSELPSENVSQANPQKATTNNLNPRIPIYSRIFPALQQ